VEARSTRFSHVTGLFGRELYAKATEIIGGARPRGRPPAANPHGHVKSVAAEHILLATSIWDAAVPPRGTATEAYLAFRGVPLPLTEDLRHCELCTDYASKIARPAMVARIRRADTGEPTGGIHRTYLLEDGRPAKEAMGGKHKMALGPTQLEGGVVMLAPMTADGRLGVAEGCETALSMTEINRRATGEIFPIWATLGDWGMANMPFPQGLKQLLIFADGGKAGIAAAERLQSRALAAGIDASYCSPKSGDYFARDLELRLWEQQQLEPEQEAKAIAQSNGSIAGAHPAAGTTDPGDSPSVSPPDVASSPQGRPLGGSNLEQAPAWFPV